MVVYGVVGLKTHAKMLLVTRREGKTVCAGMAPHLPGTTACARRVCYTTWSF